MFRQVLAVWLSCFIMAAATPEERTRKLMEKVSAIPEGTIVEVKTVDNQQWTGRIGEMTSTGFSVQTVRNGRVESIAVEYSRAKSVKVFVRADQHRGSTGKTAGWVVVGGLAVMGAIALIAFVAYISGGS